jgi:hypothetical protein
MTTLTRNPIDRTPQSLPRARKYLESLSRFCLLTARADDPAELYAALTILRRDVPRTIASLAPELRH